MQYSAGSQVLSDWKIVRELGEGSFGSVYEIQKTDFGITSKSALKVIRIPRSVSDIKSAIADGMDEQSVTTYFQGIVNEIVKEIAIMASLKSHPNIVSCEDHRVVAHGASIGWDILIRMELLTPLDDFQVQHPMNEGLVRRLGMDICSALVFCQKKGLIHRDIKPGNLFISEAGLFKLGDFGVARTAEKTTGGLSKKGTEHYMAPEVYLGRPYGASVDVYSLGLVLYKFMNGNRLPFFPPYPQPITPDSRENALISRIQGKPLAAPANASPEFARVILKACAHDPKQRYATAGEMLEDLRLLPELQDSGYAAPAAVEDTMSTLLDPTYYSSGTAYTATQDASRPARPQNQPASPKYQIVLTGSGSNKLSVIAAVRKIIGLGLQDAKALVDSAPQLLKKDITWEEAQSIAQEILEAGGSYEVSLSGSPVKIKAAEPQSAPKIEPVRIPTPQKDTATPKSAAQTTSETPPKSTIPPKKETPPVQTDKAFADLFTVAQPSQQVPPAAQPKSSRKAQKKSKFPALMLILPLVAVLVIIIATVIGPKSQSSDVTSEQPQTGTQEAAEAHALLADEYEKIDQQEESDHVLFLSEIYQMMLSSAQSQHYIYNVPMPSSASHDVHLRDNGFLFEQPDGTYTEELCAYQIEAGIEEYISIAQPENAVLDDALGLLGTVHTYSVGDDTASAVEWVWNSGIEDAEALYGTTTFTDSLPMRDELLCLSTDFETYFGEYFGFEEGLLPWMAANSPYISDTICFEYTADGTTSDLFLWDPTAAVSSPCGLRFKVVTLEDGSTNHLFRIEYKYDPETVVSSAPESQQAAPLTDDAAMQAAWEAVWKNVVTELSTQETVPFNMAAPDMTIDQYAEFMLGMGCEFNDADLNNHASIVWQEDDAYGRTLFTELNDQTSYLCHISADDMDAPGDITYFSCSTSVHTRDMENPDYGNGVMPALFDLQIGDSFETLCGNMGITQEMIDWLGGEMNEFDDFDASKEWANLYVRYYASTDSQTYRSLEFRCLAASGTVRNFSIVLAYDDDGYWHISPSVFYQE